MLSFNKLITLVAIPMIISACTVTHAPRTTMAQPKPQPAEQWYKEGVSQSVTRDKVGHCKIEVGASRLSQAEAEKLIGYCMKSDGYRLIKKSSNLNWLDS